MKQCIAEVLETQSEIIQLQRNVIDPMFAVQAQQVGMGLRRKYINKQGLRLICNLVRQQNFLVRQNVRLTA